MAVLLDLMERYPDKFLPGTDYVASFGVHDDFPGYTPIDGSPLSTPKTLEGVGDRVVPGTKGFGDDRGGCHKTEMTHSEQITDTSSLNMFYNDQLFTSMVLGTNFFRVAGLETKFQPPPLCRHDPETPESTTTIGWTPTRATVIEQAATQPAAMPMLNEITRTPTSSMPSSADPAPAAASPVWNVIAIAVAVAAALGLLGLMYVAGLKHGAKGASEEGLPYRLQTGDAPLLQESA